MAVLLLILIIGATELLLLLSADLPQALTAILSSTAKVALLPAAIPLLSLPLRFPLPARELT